MTARQSHGREPSARAWRGTWLPAVLYLVALVALVACIVWVAMTQYHSDLARSEERLTSKGELAAEWMLSMFAASEQTLVGLSQLFDAPDQSRVLEQSVEVSTFLRRRSDSLDFVDELLLASPDGHVNHASSPNMGPSFSVADTDVYRFLIEHPRQGGVLSTLYWSDRAVGYRILHLLRIRDSSGALTGLAIGRIDPEILAQRLMELDLVEGESIALVDANGGLIARRPAISLRVGEAVPSDDEHSRLSLKDERSAFEKVSSLDGERRLFVANRVGSRPFWVVVGQSKRTILAGWTQRVWALVVAGMLVALLGWLLLRYFVAQRVIGDRLRREVHERRLAQQDTQSREARLQALIGSMQDLVFVIDGDGRFTYVHASDESQLLAPPEQLMGRHFRSVLPDDVAERADTALDRLGKTRQPQRLDYRLELGDEPRYFSALFSPLADQDNGLDGVLAVVRDVTEERKQQAELSISAMAFETHLGMMITDEQGAILRVNKTFTQITGYSESEIRGRNPRVLSSGRHDASFYRRLWMAVVEKGSWQGEVWNRRKNGEVYPQWLTISGVLDEHGRRTHLVATLSDMTESKAAEREIHQLAFYDPLTGLPNRRLMLERLNDAMVASQSNGRFGAMLFIDLDNFKRVNDALGHYCGDKLLQTVANRFQAVLRDRDTLARLGGDEFVVLVRDLGTHADDVVEVAETIARKLLDTLERSCELGEASVSVTASVGITLFRDGVTTLDELLQQADMALFQAKSLGRNVASFFDPELQARLKARTRLEADLSQALERGELFLVYQRQVDDEERLTGAEALLRWRHPELGLVPPPEFITLAEESRLISRIGLWVLEQACQRLVEWEKDPARAVLSLSVNVSPKQFREPGFVEEVEAILKQTKAPPARLKLEVTETLFVEDRDDIRVTMLRLKALGVTFALDDFGTGYSSLSYLKRLPLDQIKIDQSFVRDVLDNTTSSAIVASTITLAHSLNLEVIAEGVETEAQRIWLIEHGCTAFQGYLFGRPDVDGVDSFFRDRDPGIV